VNIRCNRLQKWFTSGAVWFNVIFKGKIPAILKQAGQAAGMTGSPISWAATIKSGSLGFRSRAHAGHSQRRWYSSSSTVSLLSQKGQSGEYRNFRSCALLAVHTPPVRRLIKRVLSISVSQFLIECAIQILCAAPPSPPKILSLCCSTE
jgi:hypothetical protein